MSQSDQSKEGESKKNQKKELALKIWNTGD